MKGFGQRLFILMRRDVYTQWRTALLAVAAAGVLVIVLSLLVLWQGGGEKFHEVLFPLLFIPGGYVLASRAFSDMHRKETIQHFLLLPAGSVEKTLSRLLFTGPGYIVLAAAGYTVASMLSFLAASLIFPDPIAPFNPLSAEALGLYAHMLVTQSFFFLGAAWFRKNQLIKTILMLAAFGFAVSLWGFISVRLVFWDYFSGLFRPDMNLHFDVGDIGALPGYSYRLVKAGELAANIIYWALLAPFCWVLAWMRVKEAEVSHGI